MDVSTVKLVQQKRDVWLADLLWAALAHIGPAVEDPWLVGGDLHLSETFDSWRGGPRGNREYLDKMAGLGLVECLRHQQGRLIPTFRNPRDDTIAHQMGHLFATPILAARLISCATGDPSAVFGGGLSDHLPIVAEFRWKLGA